MKHKLVSGIVAAVWLGAFALSYDHARNITGPHDWTGYVWPLVLDVATIAGTFVLVTARREIAKRGWLIVLGLALLLPGLALSGWANFEAGTSTFLIVASCSLPWFVLVTSEVLSVLHRREGLGDAEHTAWSAILPHLAAYTVAETERLETLADRVSALPDRLAELETALSAQVVRAAVLVERLGVRIEHGTRVPQPFPEPSADDSGDGRPATPSMIPETVPAPSRKPSPSRSGKPSPSRSGKPSPSRSRKTPEPVPTPTVERVRELDAEHGRRVSATALKGLLSVRYDKAKELRELADRPTLSIAGGTQ